MQWCSWSLNTAYDVAAVVVVVVVVAAAAAAAAIF